MTAQIFPTEDWEQTCFVNWLEANSYIFTSIPNNTYTRSWSQKNKNKRNGLRPGLPDLIVLLPDRVCWVEMKRVKGGTVSKEQKEWIAALNGRGTPAAVCKGFEAAKSFILEQEALARVHESVQNEALGENV